MAGSTPKPDDSSDRLHHLKVEFDGQQHEMPMAPPGASWLQPPVPVQSRLRADGLSLARIGATLRVWARSWPDVACIVLGHTGAAYVLAIRIDDASLQNVRIMNDSLVFLCDLLNGVSWDTCILGPVEAEASVFIGPGTYTILARDDSAHELATTAA